MQRKYRTSAHAVYEIKYHFVMVPKYRFKILEGKIKIRLKEIISQICENLEILIVEGKICKDHVHICLSVPPKLSASEVMKQIKGKTAEVMFEEFPQLRKRYWGQHFWARGYFVSTVGIDSATIQKYVKEQLEDQMRQEQLSFWRDDSE